MAHRDFCAAIITSRSSFEMPYRYWRRVFLTAAFIFSGFWRYAFLIFLRSRARAPSMFSLRHFASLARVQIRQYWASPLGPLARLPNSEEGFLVLQTRQRRPSDVIKRGLKDGFFSRRSLARARRSALSRAEFLAVHSLAYLAWQLLHFFLKPLFSHLVRPKSSLGFSVLQLTQITPCLPNELSGLILEG